MTTLILILATLAPSAGPTELDVRTSATHQQILGKWYYSDEVITFLADGGLKSNGKLLGRYSIEGEHVLLENVGAKGKRRYQILTLDNSILAIQPVSDRRDSAIERFSRSPPPRPPMP